MVKSIRENFYEQSRAKEYSKKKHFLFSQREKSRSEELCKCLDSLFANHILVWTRHAQLHPIEFCLLPMRPSPSIREMMMMMYNSFVKTQDDRFIMILSRQIRPDEHVNRGRWFFCAAAFADTFISVASFRAGKIYYIYIALRTCIRICDTAFALVIKDSVAYSSCAHNIPIKLAETSTEYTPH